MQTLYTSTLGEHITIQEDAILSIDSLDTHTIVVAPHIRTDIILITDTDTKHTHTLTITLGERSVVRMWSACFASTHLTLTAELSGHHAVFEHYSLYIGTHSQAITEHVRCVHTAEDTMSRTIVSGIALDQSRIDVKGMIDIALNGHRADTHFGHEGLLLSRTARIDAEPGLQIHTNDVKATHSSAVHFIRPEQLFYLHTRSLNEQDARRMIAEGFVAAALPPLPDPSAIERIERCVEHSLASL